MAEGYDLKERRHTKIDKGPLQYRAAETALFGCVLLPDVGRECYCGHKGFHFFEIVDCAISACLCVRVLCFGSPKGRRNHLFALPNELP